VMTSEETGREKPASVMFTLPLAQLDRKPSEAVMVGDSVASDIEGANAVGLTTVLFNADPGGLSGRQRPDHYVESFEGVGEVVL
jgi:FMN phosphatase YigB (HAD superfamily)